MDWTIIVIIVLAIVGLAVIYGLTGTSSAINCMDKHKARNRKHFKDGNEQEDTGK